MKPTASLIAAADAQWPIKRRPKDVHTWSWAALVRASHDAFCVVGADQRPMCLWCTNAPEPLALPGGTTYRLDYLEVDPKHRGSELSVFSLGLIATRALECEAVQLVLASFPQSRQLYDRTGGRQEKADGWMAEEGLLPYLFSRRALLTLQEAANATKT